MILTPPGNSVVCAANTTVTLFDLTSRNGWLDITDSAGGHCRLAINGTTLPIVFMFGSAIWVFGVPLTAQYGLAMSGTKLQLTTGLTAAGGPFYYKFEGI